MKAPLSIGKGFSKTGDAETAAHNARDMAGEKITFAIVFSSSSDRIQYVRRAGIYIRRRCRPS